MLVAAAYAVRQENFETVICFLQQVTNYLELTLGVIPIPLLSQRDGRLRLRGKSQHTFYVASARINSLGMASGMFSINAPGPAESSSFVKFWDRRHLFALMPNLRFTMSRGC